MTAPEVSVTEGAAREAAGPTTPQEIASAFKEQIRDAAAESGFLAPPSKSEKTRTRTGKPGAPVVPLVPPPLWTPDGIGSVVTMAHDMAFAAFDVPSLEPEEQKQLSNASAKFLNAAWPTGASWEPHAAMVLTELSIIVPRVAAYQMQRKAEREAAENKKKISKNPEAPETVGLG